MQWSNINKYLEGEPTDLLEVFFLDLSASSWKDLFIWMSDRVIVLDCQFGRLNIDELNVESFLNGSMSYVAHIKGSSGIELSISAIDECEASIDVEIESINNEESFRVFLENISEISRVIHCKKYIVCQEFKREKPFIVNGVLV
ncbi:hypothetical protein TYM08_P1560 [Marinicellulosiphila megalodicopiae]